MAKKALGTKLYNSNYILDKYLTSGGMSSEVYLAHDVSNPNKKLIAKIITKEDDEDLESFKNAYRNEHITSLRLQDKPNLVQTYNAFFSDDGNEAIIIQEYVEGLSLDNFLDKKGVLTPRVALCIFKQILIGVQALHNFKQQIIHCDLKPQNIVISNDLSKVTIIDFGISTVLQKDKAQKIEKILTDNRSRGTEGYVSPDYCSNKITVQYDFYALGAILYVMLFGEYPFKRVKRTKDFGSEEKNKKEDNNCTIRTIKKPLTYDIINISANPTIPVDLENLIFRCLASKPKDLKFRYTNISQIIDDVDKIINQIDTKSTGGKLLKPLHERNYEAPDPISISRLEDRNAIYQKWWFALIITGAAIILIIIAMIIFFVVK